MQLIFAVGGSEKICKKSLCVRQVILQRKTLLSAMVLKTVAKIVSVTNSGAHCLIQMLCSVCNSRFCFTEENYATFVLPGTWEDSLDKLNVEKFGTALKNGSKNRRLTVLYWLFMMSTLTPLELTERTQISPCVNSRVHTFRPRSSKFM